MSQAMKRHADQKAGRIPPDSAGAYYEKPSVKRKRKRVEALKKRRKIERKKAEYESRNERNGENKFPTYHQPNNKRRD